VCAASCWLNRTFNDSRQVVNIWRHAFQVNVGRSGPLVPQEELDVSQPCLLRLDKAHGEKMPYCMKTKAFDLSLLAKVFHHIPYGLLAS